MASEFTALLNEVALIQKTFHHTLDMGFLIFCRLLGLMIIAPLFGRKDVPFPIKISMALVLAVLFVWILPSEPVKVGEINSENVMWFLLQVFINASIGFLIGWIAAVILDTVNSAGSLMNNQVGLSSAMMFDPGTRQQVALLEKLFGLIGLMIFFNLGGIYWIISAIHRSFEVFPVAVVNPDVVGQIHMDYIVGKTGNSLSVALQLIAPVMVVTMAVDMILGIVNRTAQQIQVFQLSFALKPCIGIAAFVLTMPIFIKMVENYLTDYAFIF